jgi:hypothetical protein
MASSEYQQRESILLKHTEKPHLSYGALSKLLKYPQNTVCSKSFNRMFNITMEVGSWWKARNKELKKEEKASLSLFTHSQFTAIVLAWS